jgi:hypothetical protein
VCIAALAAWSTPAGAVIKVDVTVSKIGDESRAVLVGTVTAVAADSRVATVRIDDAVKGESPAPEVRVQVPVPPDLFARVAVGGRAALFIAKSGGGSVALVHLGDAWLMAQRVPDATPPLWRVAQPYEAGETFPGRTAALVRLLGEMKAGKPTLLNHVDPLFLRGGIREAAKLGVTRPTFLAAADASGDGKPDLLVGTPDGARLFLAAGDGYQDATAPWGLAGAAGACPAFGDLTGDGKADLLLGGTVWVNQGAKFAAAPARLDLPDGAKTLAATIADLTADKKADAAVLLADGRLLVFENPGAPDKPWRRLPDRALWREGPPGVAAAFGDWGDDGRPHVLVVRETGLARYALGEDGPAPADYARLTGKRQAEFFKGRADGLKGAAAAALDANGDGRRDFLLLAEGGSLLLVNRGFGTFLAVLDLGEALKSGEGRTVPFQLGPATPWTAADTSSDRRDDLLVLTEDGRLFDVRNAPGTDGAAGPAR